MSSAAIVTGSDSGIGRAVAVALARAGFDIGITWHTDSAGASTTAREVRETGRKAAIQRLDLARTTEIPEVIDDLSKALGRLDA